MTVRAMLLASALLPLVYDAGKPGWKMEGDKLALDANGNPIYIDASGREASVESGTIARLNNEAKTHREAKEQAEAQLAAFKGADGKLIDPEIAKKAVDTVSKLDAKRLIDAGEVDKVRDAVKAEFTGQLKEKDAAIEERDNRINSMVVDGVFANSEFVRDKLAMPRDFFQDAMRKHFKVEDGKPVAYDRSGNRLMSKKRVGEYADPDEALELLVEQHPQKDTIIKAPSGGGSGNGGGGGARGSGRRISRADWDALGGVEKAAAATAMAKGELIVAD